MEIEKHKYIKWIYIEMGLIDIVIRGNFTPIAFMTLIAAVLWIYGNAVNSSSLYYDAWAVFIAGCILQVLYLVVRFMI